jgi:hypothetical protein
MASRQHRTELKKNNLERVSYPTLGTAGGGRLLYRGGLDSQRTPALLGSILHRAVYAPRPDCRHFDEGSKRAHRVPQDVVNGIAPQIDAERANRRGGASCPQVLRSTRLRGEPRGRLTYSSTTTLPRRNPSIWCWIVSRSPTNRKMAASGCAYFRAAEFASSRRTDAIR